jgi:hypothetical protein
LLPGLAALAVRCTPFRGGERWPVIAATCRARRRLTCAPCCARARPHARTHAPTAARLAPRCAAPQTLNKVVFIREALNEDLANNMIALTLYLDSLDKKRIYYWLNCPGGDVSGCSGAPQCTGGRGGVCGVPLLSRACLGPASGPAAARSVAPPATQLFVFVCA